MPVAWGPMAAPCNSRISRFESNPRAQAAGDVVVFEDDMGNAGFVSHQWLGKQHPDPEFKQMKVLQEALSRLLTGHGLLPLDVVTESFVPSAKGIPFEAFQSRALFVWYDFFSVPQLTNVVDDGTESKTNAIESIPGYVARCRFFFALCPTIDCPFQAKVLSHATWSSRGWCRLERASRELSENDNWVLIQSAGAMEVIGTMTSCVSGPIGEGDFSVEADKAKLARVMYTILKRKLSLALRAGDLPSYRRHLNLQSVHLRGLNLESINVFPIESEDLVENFLHQNRLTHVNRRDSAGWWPLHYAALSGHVALINALLARKADVNRRTTKDEPTLGSSAHRLAVLLVMSSG